MDYRDYIGFARVQLYSWQFFRIRLEITAWMQPSKIKRECRVLPISLQLLAAANRVFAASLRLDSLCKLLLEPYARMVARSLCCFQSGDLEA